MLECWIIWLRKEKFEWKAFFLTFLCYPEGFDHISLKSIKNYLFTYFLVRGVLIVIVKMRSKVVKNNIFDNIQWFASLPTPFLFGKAKIFNQICKQASKTIMIVKKKTKFISLQVEQQGGMPLRYVAYGFKNEQRKCIKAENEQTKEKKMYIAFPRWEQFI